jgi:hypothetical protein
MTFFSIFRKFLNFFYFEKKSEAENLSSLWALCSRGQVHWTFMKGWTERLNWSNGVLSRASTTLTPRLAAQLGIEPATSRLQAQWLTNRATLLLLNEVSQYVTRKYFRWEGAVNWLGVQLERRPGYHGNNPNSWGNPSNETGNDFYIERSNSAVLVHQKVRSWF